MSEPSYASPTASVTDSPALSTSFTPPLTNSPVAPPI